MDSRTLAPRFASAFGVVITQITYVWVDMDDRANYDSCTQTHIGPWIIAPIPAKISQISHSYLSLDCWLTEALSIDVITWNLSLTCSTCLFPYFARAIDFMS
ncbi:hypothetical protein SISNIDRAFT_450237 [Sistotremastrum niveocremeum HHB9708]|uniref:Uncharacterized protein n=1 Tax=Sistotremastrum niveocremeum HHB9708 TaxID=1314777 RepID=A0A164Z1B7_9AGAM|nr:hypothetical protein SISNIDRAFT_450237 [Sistotremastrum niveocremeum HHB9708]